MPALTPDLLRRIAVVLAAFAVFAAVAIGCLALDAEAVALPAASVAGLLVAALGTRALDTRR
jgi:hypothetical protein